MKKYLVTSFCIITLMVSLYIISHNIEKDNQIKNNDIELYTHNKESKIDILLNSMNIEEKVGQLFICAYRKDTEGKNIYVLTNEIKEEIDKYNLGGVILFSENIQNAEQLRNLNKGISNINKKFPLFICIDVEGGLVDRLAKSKIVTKLPYISKLGETQDTNLSYEYGKIIGRRLSSLGININFAPVCDLDNSSSIKHRSFGKDPIIVGKMAEAYISGLNEYNIGSCLKHFPGLGSSDKDTHEYIAHSDITINTLKSRDIIPFKYGLNAGSNIVMISHVIYNNLSNIPLPASINKDIYKLLKEELSFDGIAITDGLEMGGITKEYTDKSPAYNAFIAGADLLLLPKSLYISYNEILAAVKSREITEERLNISVKRILEYKDFLGLFNNNEIYPNLYDDNDENIINLITN